MFINCAICIIHGKYLFIILMLSGYSTYQGMLFSKAKVISLRVGDQT